MDARQDAKLSMYRGLAAFCDANTAIISINVAFIMALNDFKANIAAITAAAQQEATVITGIAMDKNQARQTVCNQTTAIAAMIYAYAATVGNNTLKMEVDFPVTALMRLREDQLAPRCQNVHDAGEANLAALADYGVTAVNLADLQTAIDNYSAIINKPRTAIIDRKMQGAAIDQLFEANDSILKDRMDKIVFFFNTANPEFVHTYEAMRRVVKPPTTVTQLRGKITDATTKTPIKNATVTATPNPAEPPAPDPIPYTTISDQLGEYSIKPIHNGDYTLNVTALGYPNFQADLEILMGEFNDFDVELEK